MRAQVRQESLRARVLGAGEEGLGVGLLENAAGVHEPDAVGEVLSVMRSLANEGMTMMCVTHEMGFAREVADRVWFMDAGHILEMAEPDAFFSAPQHARAQRFLSDLRH